MARSSSSSSPLNLEDEDLDGLKHEWRLGHEFVEYNGFFCPQIVLEGVKAAQAHFQPRPDDVFLCGSMKTGTTWLKALVAAILASHEEEKRDVLSQHNPHHLIQNLELFWPTGTNATENLAAILFKPRVLQTHLPFFALPPKIRSLGCRIIYLCRNPKDTVVSYWHFMNKVHPGVVDLHGVDSSLEAAMDAFCSGVCHFGPFCDHVLGFWNAAKYNPNILFLHYEDMKADNSASYVRRIADFVGRSSLTDEEIERIHWQCSFERLSELEVNQSGRQEVRNFVQVQNKIFFRKGQVGDWKNYLTAEMNRRLESMVDKKVEGSDLRFRYE